MLPNTINEVIADDLYKQIRWLSIKNKTLVMGYLLERIIGEKVYEHHGFKRLWEKYEKSKLPKTTRV